MTTAPCSSSTAVTVLRNGNGSFLKRFKVKITDMIGGTTYFEVQHLIEIAVV